MPKTLLAVDDSATMRKVLEITFGGDDFQVVTADNRDKALAQLAGKPAVVLIDAALGSGDEGYALSKEVRSRDNDAVIILLSSRHAPYDAAKGKDAGCDDFMDKPFDTTQAIDKVKKAVAARAGGGAQVAGATAPAANVPAPAPAPAPAPIAAKPAPAPAPAPAPVVAAKPTASPFGAPAAAAPAQKSRSATLMFGGEVNPSKSPGAGPVAPVIPGGNAPPAGSGGRPVPAKPSPELVATAQSASHAPAQPAARSGSGAGGGSHVAAAVNGQLGAKLSELGLSKDQAEAVMALSREVVERVVWEVVPQLAEVMIREELARLTKE
ncbi:MAG: response regulator [Polyangiaceae bacterium]